VRRATAARRPASLRRAHRDAVELQYAFAARAATRTPHMRSVAPHRPQRTGCLAATGRAIRVARPRLPHVGSGGEETGPGLKGPGRAQETGLKYDSDSRPGGVIGAYHYKWLFVICNCTLQLQNVQKHGPAVASVGPPT
jgi:hypothetical protein